MDKAVALASNGPVHLNCRFRAPMSFSDNGVGQIEDRHFMEWEKSNSPFKKGDPVQDSAESSEVEEAIALLKGAERGLILVGQLDVEGRVRTHKNGFLSVSLGIRQHSVTFQ